MSLSRRFVVAVAPPAVARLRGTAFFVVALGVSLFWPGLNGTVHAQHSGWLSGLNVGSEVAAKKPPALFPQGSLTDVSGTNRALEADDGPGVGGPPSPQIDGQGVSPIHSPGSASMPVWMAGLMGANIAANVADLFTTNKALQQGGREANPMMRQPWLRYGTKAGMLVATNWLAVKWWQSGRKKQAVIVTVLSTVVAAVAADHNQHQLRAR